MRQCWQMFLFEIRTAFKDYMGAYIMIAPLLILIVLRFFLPDTDSTAATVAVVDKGPQAVEESLVAELAEFADVKRYDNIEDMNRKLRGTGTAEGLYRDPQSGRYVSVLERNIEGNTVFSTGARVVRRHYYRENYPDAPEVNTFTHRVPAELSDRSSVSPVATMGGSVFIVFMVIIAAFIIGLGVVEDKESGTDSALRVTPLSKSAYFIGKSLYPLLVTAVYTIIALLILGLMRVNILQVYLLVLLSFSVTLLMGLLIGALAGNENEAIGVGKMLAMVVMLSILGGTLLPGKWQWVVWWAPFFWVYDILESILTRTATWTGFAWKSAVMLGTTALYFFLLKKKIVKGLS